MGIEDRSFSNPDMERVEFSEERLGSLYAALGNNEAKAITFLTMRPGVIYDGQEIVTAVRRAQGNTQKGWKMGEEGPFHYLQKSFAPVGLVAMEVTDRKDNKYGYIRTPWGNAIGTAFAGKMLQLSYQHSDISLYDLFGSTVSTSKPLDDGEELKKRSPLSRIHLFREIISSGDKCVSISDLAGKMGETDATLVRRHVKDLVRAGILTFDENTGQILVKEESNKLLFDVVVDFQSLLDLNPVTLEEGRAFAARVMASPDTVAAFMKKAKEHSRNANQKPIEETSNEVISIIQQHPGLTTEEVRARLEEDFQRALSVHRVRRIIHHAFNSRGLSIPHGRSVRWSLES